VLDEAELRQLVACAQSQSFARQSHWDAAIT
jgi:hypothetical protein